MLPSEVIKAIDADIEKHHKRAGEMLDVVNVILAVASLMLVIYFVPSMCERWLAGMEKEVEKVKADYEAAAAAFRETYKEKHIFISKEDFEELAERGTIDKKTTDARRVSQVRGTGFFEALTVIVQLIAGLKMEDSKIEFVLKMLPVVMGAILAGFLVTYRLHVLAAKDLAVKKIDLFGHVMEKREADSTAAQQQGN